VNECLYMWVDYPLCLSTLFDIELPNLACKGGKEHEWVEVPGSHGVAHIFKVNRSNAPEVDI